MALWSLTHASCLPMTRDDRMDLFDTDKLVDWKRANPEPAQPCCGHH